MKKQASAIALGALLALVMTAPSFAATHTVKHAVRQTKPAAAYSGYYDAAVPEGNYTTYAPSYSTTGPSADMGGLGH